MKNGKFLLPYGNYPNLIEYNYTMNDLIIKHLNKLSDYSKSLDESNKNKFKILTSKYLIVDIAIKAKVKEIISKNNKTKLNLFNKFINGNIDEKTVFSNYTFDDNKKTLFLKEEKISFEDFCEEWRKFVSDLTFINFNEFEKIPNKNR